MDHITAYELAELIGCKQNQRAAMVRWLDKQHWRYVVNSHGMPKVAREYYNRKMGIAEEKISPKYAEVPNLKAFA
jgi:hypothetical protein